MNDSPDKLQSLEQENEDLKQKNVDLEKYIESIKNATDEFKKLKEEATVNDVVNKAVAKIAKWLGISFVVSVTGLIGLFLAVGKVATDTANGIVTTEFKSEKKINEIRDTLLKKESEFTTELIAQLTNSLQKDKDFINSVTTSLPARLSKEKDFLVILATKLANLPEFVDRTRAEAKTTVLQSLNDQKNKVDKEANPELSNGLSRGRLLCPAPLG